jgi:23S rRNA (uracil1939-C5)-methyltransferase
MSPREFEITLTTLAHGGEGVGRLPDGRTVFVPFGLPGEYVRIRLTEERKRFARGSLINVLRASPDRVPPRCKHFGACGGCQYQHLGYDQQLEAKSRVLTDQLVHIGRIKAPPVRPTVASPEEWNYRNHVQFHLTPTGRPGYIGVGPHRRGREEILAIEECHLPVAPINSLWPQLEFEADSAVERASFRAGTADDLTMILEMNSASEPEVELEDGISVATIHGDAYVLLAGSAHTAFKILDREFQVSTASFFQTNTAIAERMVQHVQGILRPVMGTLVDAYCGVGLFSAFLAPACGRLVAIESSVSACQDFAANLEEFENVELYEDLVERVLPSLDIAAEAVLVDPPRSGLSEDALDAILQLAPERIIYVSCEPATLARDAERIIRGGYVLQQVTPFDMFPQTYHIESISEFGR